MAEEWVDHALGQAREVEGKLEEAEKTHMEIEKRLKDILFHVDRVEESRKNAEFALVEFEKQAEEARASQNKVETQLALAIVKTKQ